MGILQNGPSWKQKMKGYQNCTILVCPVCFLFATPIPAKAKWGFVTREICHSRKVSVVDHTIFQDAKRWRGTYTYNFITQHAVECYKQKTGRILDQRKLPSFYRPKGALCKTRIILAEEFPGLTNEDMKSICCREINETDTAYYKRCLRILKQQLSKNDKTFIDMAREARSRWLKAQDRYWNSRRTELLLLVFAGDDRKVEVELGHPNR